MLMGHFNAWQEAVKNGRIEDIEGQKQKLMDVKVSSYDALSDYINDLKAVFSALSNEQEADLFKDYYSKHILNVNNIMFFPTLISQSLLSMQPLHIKLLRNFFDSAPSGDVRYAVDMFLKENRSDSDKMMDFFKIQDIVPAKIRDEIVLFSSTNDSDLFQILKANMKVSARILQTAQALIEVQQETTLTPEKLDEYVQKDVDFLELVRMGVSADSLDFILNHKNIHLARDHLNELIEIALRYTEEIIVLLQNRVPMNQPLRSGETPLMSAIRMHGLKGLKLLLKSDSDLNIQHRAPLGSEHAGKTALFLATRGEYPELKVLVQKGARLTRTDLEKLNTKSTGILLYLESIFLDLKQPFDDETKAWLNNMPQQSINNLVIQALKKEMSSTFLLLLHILPIERALGNPSLLNELKQANVFDALINLASYYDQKGDDLDTVLPGFKQNSELMQTLKALPSKYYATSIETLSKLIYTPRDPHSNKNPPVIQKNPPMLIISNNEGYPVSSGRSIVRGERLFLNDDATTPIGYNIHLPLNKPTENVLVNVYGGGRTPYRPGELSPQEAMLLEQGTAIVTLNLLDLLDETTQKYQGDMPIEVYEKMQSSINYFYTVFKNHPEKLNDKLAELNIKNKKMFLSGSSFGGLTVVNQAKRFPGTFSGYISFNGFLAPDIDTHRKRKRYTEALIDSAQADIDKLSDPVLLMQNRDDNNVNAKITLEFYNRLKKNNKAHLAQVLVMETSDPKEPGMPWGHKGHFPHETHLTRMKNVMTHFMRKGLAEIPEVTRAQSFTQDKLANKYFAEATVKQQFIAEIFEQARSDKTLTDDLKSFANSTTTESTIWATKLEPLFYAILIVHLLSENKEALEAELQRLKEANLPTDEMIKKALLMQSANIAQFMEEAHGLKLTPEEITSDAFVNEFRQIMETLPTRPTLDSTLIRYMLSALYQSNPQLLQPLYVELKEDIGVQSALNESKKSLKKNFLHQRKLIAKMWQGSAREGLKKTSLAKLDIQIYKMIAHIDNIDPHDFTLLDKLARKAQQYKNLAEDIAEKMDILIQHCEDKGTPNAKDVAVKIDTIKENLKLKNSKLRF